MNRRTHTVTLSALSALVGASLALGATQVLADTSPTPTHVVSTADQPTYALQDGKLLAQILLDEASVGGTAASMTRLVAHPGATAPEHTHDGDELVYVLHGRAITQLGETTYELGEGMAMRIPQGTSHSLTVPQQDTPLEVLVIYAAAGAEQRFKAGTVVAPSPRTDLEEPPG